VILVPAPALEVEGRRAQELLDVARFAGGALGDGIIRELLDHVELMAAVRAAVFVDGHIHSRGWLL